MSAPFLPEKLTPLTGGFTGTLAKTLYDVSNASEEEASDQNEVLGRIESWLRRASEQNGLWSSFEANSAYSMLDTLTPLFDGSGLLRFARLIERMAPSAFEHMPRMLEHQTHLAQSFDLARLFVPTRLEMLIRGIEIEGAR